MARFLKIYAIILTLGFLSQACSAEQQSAPAEVSNQLGIPATATETTPTPIPTIEPMQPAATADDAAPVASSAIVTITAVEGDIAIRKGPDKTFDATTSLKNGETATVLARSIMDGWVQIEIPSQAGETGWISVESNYSIVSGNLLDLPRIDAVEWNVGSYLINCTPHKMLVKPGDVTIAPQGEAPNNRVWFPPGTYSVYDLDVTGEPVAANLTITEHREYHILKDGTRKQWTCE